MREVKHETATGLPPAGSSSLVERIESYTPRYRFEDGHGSDVKDFDQIADHAREVTDTIERHRAYDVSPYEAARIADQHDIQTGLKW